MGEKSANVDMVCQYSQIYIIHKAVYGISISMYKCHPTFVGNTVIVGSAVATEYER